MYMLLYLLTDGFPAQSWLLLISAAGGSVRALSFFNSMFI